MNLNTVDLNLLVAFDALIAERSVSRAAEKLGVTQPAVSHALKRLRYLFKDDLLARGPHGMQPTGRALSLHPGGAVRACGHPFDSSARVTPSIRQRHHAPFACR